MHDVTDRNELIFRRVRGILNKLTPDNFDKLSYNLLNIGIDKTVLKGIIILIYEKAIDESKYCNLYAQLCLRLRHDVPNFDDPVTKTNTFVRLLLSKCQEEFETRSKASSAFDKKDTDLSPDEKQDKMVAKRKMLGNIKFIGELGKLELLQEAILHKCIQQLLAKKKRTSLSEMAEDIECMCQIMSTIGRRLDTPKALNIMNQYFDRIEKLSTSMELPSRIRFMLRDVLELRYNKWVPRLNQEENGPRSVSQMRWEAMGMMMPPPFPFFHPGMPLPPGMQMPPNMPAGGMPPFMPNGDMSTMPWFNDQVLACGGMISSDSKLPADFHDETKDIFGKPVNKTQSLAPKQHTPISKPIMKPDLFQPHYMKSKANGNGPPSRINGNSTAASSNTAPSSTQLNGAQSKEKDKKPINKNNPWNVDPFMPNFSKPSISLITQKEEASKHAPPNARNNSTPPQRISPQTIPRNSAANTYQKQQTQQQQQAWKKNNQEVSLRPASSLTKKDDGKSKADELSGKQFTNLTINDKTNKPKKTGLSKSDVDKKIVEVNESHKKDEDTTKACNDLQSLATNLKYSKMVAKQLLIFTSSQNEEEWARLVQLITQCVEKSIFSEDTLVNAYNLLLDDIKVIESGNGKNFMALIASTTVEKDWIKLSTVMESFEDGAHYPAPMNCLSNLHKSKGKDWLMSMLKKQKIDCKKIFPKDEWSDNAIMQVAQNMEMTFLFPQLCLKEELLKMMKEGANEDELIQWIKDNENELNKKQLVHLVVTCSVTIATQITFENGGDLQQKPDKETQELEKEILGRLNGFLRQMIGPEMCDQLEAVYALQVFCHDKDFPKEMLLRMFLCFYNMEIIDEDVFLKWKEDINDSYPGKGKSLFQVNNWLQWLETADEEEEEEENADDAE
ncbi:eukaryotic translation initiation factor 4 gamma 2-like [Clytia hemisphaerica]|uniref:Eukaryotic translation initiation factor 4 gamma 2 n=1 Tax=Clytia hemisphaerica TaxID=252671 RepID=A0A7M6DN51_9CNID